MIRAYVSDAQWGASIGISLVMHGEQPDIPRRILPLGGEGQQFTRRWDELDPMEGVEPTLILDHEVAVALMQALNTRYSGVDDALMLRKDYQDERKRVDGLIDVLAEVVRGSSRG